MLTARICANGCCDGRMSIDTLGAMLS